MKTSEFKEIVENNGFKLYDAKGYLKISKNNYFLAYVYEYERSNFTISRSDMLNDETIDAIIEYAKTPVLDRKEKYINVDIPVSDWEKINSGFIYDKDESNENKANIHFFDNEGFDAMFVTLRLIQAKYEDEYQK